MGRKSKKRERCSNCGYCPTCGRSKMDTPQVCTRPHVPTGQTYTQSAPLRFATGGNN